MSSSTAILLGFLFMVLIAGGSILLNMLILTKNPYVFKTLSAKKLVWEVSADGTLKPKKATQEGLAYRTSEGGVYEYEREDVVMYGKTPGIIVYRPYSKALRPDVVPFLQKLKDWGITRYNTYIAIATAEELTPQEFQKLQKSQKTTEAN